jgi:uncharacterized protein
MKIHVSRIPEEGLTEHASYNASKLDMERQDVRLPEPFEVDAFITRIDRELVIRAQIRSPLLLVCGRCLDEYSSVVTAKNVYTYEVRPTDVVDITDDVRQDVILAYPMIPLCRPDCKGLCLTCGQNLNHGSCAHASNGQQKRGDDA